jgi:hypothetical protein
VATERQREAARATARKLMAEGRWGGAVGRAVDNGGRRRAARTRGALKPATLIAILEAVAPPGEHIEARRLFRDVPTSALDLDHQGLTRLVAELLAAALGHEAVPQRAMVDGGRAYPVWRSRGVRPHRPGAVTHTIPDPEPDDFAHYTDAELLDVLLLTLGVPSPPYPEKARAAELLSGLAARVREAAEHLLAEATG